VGFTKLRRFCGTAVSTTLSVPTARYHLRGLFKDIQYRRPRRGDVQLGRQALKDLKWWTALQDNAATGRQLWPGASTILMVTEASGTGWGAVLNQSAKARGCHGVDRNGLHINCLELGAVARALLLFRHLLPSGSIIRLRTDSMVALGVMRAESSRSPVLMGEMRSLHDPCTEMHVELRIEHVFSALNEWEDRFSREHDTTDWTFKAATFATIDAKCGPHSIDLFASTASARCPRFYARWMCPGALATNALQQDLANENAWANPPFHLVGAVVSQALRTNATVTMIAPVWRAQQWWQWAVDGCTEWYILPAADGVFTHASRSAPATRPFWRTAVFRFGPTHF